MRLFSTVQEFAAKPVAALYPWFNVDSLENAVKNASLSSSDDAREWTKQLKNIAMRDYSRPVARPPTLNELDQLQSSHPNFAEVISFLAEQGALSRRRHEPYLLLPPILLEGEPGVGKSHFARSLSRLLGSDYAMVDFATLTAGFALSGTMRHWSSGAMGLIAQTMRDAKTVSPLFFLDELDKANQESKSNPLGGLYSLLERESAKTFRDEYLEVDFDVSRAYWIAAANAPQDIPLPLLSRFTRFVIYAPTNAELATMLSSHYLRRCKELSGFPQTLPESWYRLLTGLSVREAFKSLDVALGRAALRADRAGKRSVELLDADLGVTVTPRKKPGFF